MAQRAGASGFLNAILKEGGFSSGKARELSSQFSTLDAFGSADFKNIKLVRSGDRTEIVLDEEHRSGAERAKRHIHPGATLGEHWIRFAADRLAAKTRLNLQGMDLETLDVDPFLVRAMNMQTPGDIARFGVYRAVARSVEAKGPGAACGMGARKEGKWRDAAGEAGDLARWTGAKRQGPAGRGPDSAKGGGREALRWIGEAASPVLRDRSVAQEIDEAVRRLVAEFEDAYGPGQEGVERYVNGAP